MTSIATVTVKQEKRPAILNGRRCFAYTAMQSLHCGFVVEFEDGTLGEAVQGIDSFRFLDSKEMFDACCWEGDAESNYERLFGTPERAARTLSRFCTDCFCGDCTTCGVPEWADYRRDYDAVLEWLESEVVE